MFLKGLVCLAGGVNKIYKKAYLCYQNQGILFSKGTENDNDTNDDNNDDDLGDNNNRQRIFPVFSCRDTWKKVKPWFFFLLAVTFAVS